jgi:hypothetical protein
VDGELSIIPVTRRPRSKSNVSEDR